MRGFKIKDIINVNTINTIQINYMEGPVRPLYPANENAFYSPLSGSGVAGTTFPLFGERNTKNKTVQNIKRKIKEQ
jgi:hypothetical protein